MSLINWVQYTEPVVGMGASIPDVTNRPLRQILTDSGLDPDADFPGFVSALNPNFVGNVNIGGNLFVADNSTFDGNVTVGGNVIISGTVTFTGNVTFPANVNVIGTFTVNTNKFSVDPVAGNTLIAGTLGVSGNIGAPTILVGNTTFPAGITATTFAVVGEAPGSDLFSIIADNTNTPGFITYKSTGTLALPTALTNNLAFGAFSARGYDGTSWSGTQGGVLISTTQSWTNTNHGTKVQIRTTPNNSTTVAITAFFDQDGSLTLGSVSGTGVGNLFSGNINGQTINSTANFTGTLNVADNFSVATNKFNVTATNGNTTIAGTLGVTSDFNVNTNSFKVTVSSGNTTIGGSLTFSTAVSKIIPGVTSFNVMNNAGTRANLNLADNGTLVLNCSDLSIPTLGFTATNGDMPAGAILVNASSTSGHRALSIFANDGTSGITVGAYYFTQSAVETVFTFANAIGKAQGSTAFQFYPKGGEVSFGQNYAASGNTRAFIRMYGTTTTNLGGSATIIVQQGGISTDTLSTSGDLTVGGRLLFSTAVSKIIPGATSISLRNNADSQDNFIITNAGAATLGFGTLTVSTGNLVLGANALAANIASVLNTASAQIRDIQYQTGGLNRFIFRVDNSAETGADAGSNFQLFARHDDGTAIGSVFSITRSTMNISFNGLLTAIGGLTVQTGTTLTLTGATVSGAPTWSSSQAITLSTAAQPNVTSVGTLTSLTVSGNVTLSQAVSVIIPGATSFAIRNNANSQNNFIITNAGAATFAGNVTLSSGGVLQTIGTTSQWNNSLGQSITQLFAGSGTTGGARYDLRGSNGTVASPTATVTTDVLGSILIQGYDGASFQGGTGLLGSATENWGVGNNGAKLSFRTVPNGSTTATIALTLDQDQSATFTNTIKTAAPSGGTAGAWKLGILVSAAITADLTKYIQLDVGGTLYKLVTAS